MPRRSELIKARVHHDVKMHVAALAAARREDESVIVREAVMQYLQRNPTPGDLRHAAEDPAPYGTLTPAKSTAGAPPAGGSAGAAPAVPRAG